MVQVPGVPDWQPFTVGQARAVGISRDILRGKGFRSVFRGVYVAAAEPDSARLRAQAAMLVGPRGALVSHQTAATLWGAVVPEHPKVHLSVAGSGRWRGTAGIVVHTVTELGRPQVHEGVPLTSPERTFLDLAARLSLVDLVVVGDSLVKKRRTTPAKLVSAAAAFRGRGARLATRAAGLVREGVDSPRETLTRMLIVLAGLPEPTVNVILYHDDGTWRRRCDLAYERLKISIEYDGRQHAENDQQWAGDVRRREEFDEDGWRVIVILSPDLYRHPDRALERIIRVRETRGIRRPRQLTPEWRQHFPGRRPVSG